MTTKRANCRDGCRAKNGVGKKKCKTMPGTKDPCAAPRCPRTHFGLYCHTRCTVARCELPRMLIKENAERLCYCATDAIPCNLLDNRSPISVIGMDKKKYLYIYILLLHCGRDIRTMYYVPRDNNIIFSFTRFRYIGFYSFLFMIIRRGTSN